MRGKISILFLIVALASFAKEVEAGLTLNSAGNFAVLADSSVSNTGPSVINGGNVGVNSTTSITGFPPGTIVAPFTTHVEDQTTNQAEADLATAYNVAAGMTRTQDLTGMDLGGLTLLPGVYFFGSSAQLTGTLILNDLGNPNAQFVFQIGSTLTTGTNSSVVTINGGTTSGTDVFWQVGSSATIGLGSALEGHILAYSSINLNTGASLLDGSALALHGAVTLDSNRITNAVVPEPSTMTLVLLGGSMVGLFSVMVRRSGSPGTG